MGRKTELETELAQIRADLDGADNDEAKAALQAKISELETALESATDEEEIEEIADDLERLKSWASETLEIPLSEIRAEMAEMKTLLQKALRKAKAVSPPSPSPLPSPEPSPEPTPPSPPSPPPSPEPKAPPQNQGRGITRL